MWILLFGALVACGVQIGDEGDQGCPSDPVEGDRVPLDGLTTVPDGWTREPPSTRLDGIDTPRTGMLVEVVDRVTTGDTASEGAPSTWGTAEATVTAALTGEALVAPLGMGGEDVCGQRVIAPGSVAITSELVSFARDGEWAIDSDDDAARFVVDLAPTELGGSVEPPALEGERVVLTAAISYDGQVFGGALTWRGLDAADNVVAREELAVLEAPYTE